MSIRQIVITYEQFLSIHTMLAALKAGEERTQIAINALWANNSKSICAKELTAVLEAHRAAIAQAEAVGIK